MATDNIKVAIRARPLIQREKDAEQKSCWSIQHNIIYQTDDDENLHGEPYSFDHIFDSHKTTAEIYDVIVKDLVQSSLDGFNSTVFAYGQTSSGKTFTMVGTKRELGLMQVAVKHIFDTIEKNLDRKFLVRLSYIEIYNEKINDLFNMENGDLKIREDRDGNSYINAKEEIVVNLHQVFALMGEGNKNRKIGCTDMNAKSSRSHCILRIKIESQKIGPVSSAMTETRASYLNFVDLAGSERISQTRAVGIRLKEGLHINKSLSALSLVIKQLSEQEKYVNFRDSTLTRLLQPALGGNAKTLIIAAITTASAEETNSTLAFAQRAKQVKNKPQINQIISNKDKYLHDFQAEFDKLMEVKVKKIQNLEEHKKKSFDVIAELEYKLRALMEYVGETQPSKIPKRRHTIGHYKSEEPAEPVTSKSSFLTPVVHKRTVSAIGTQALQAQDAELAGPSFIEENNLPNLNGEKNAEGSTFSRSSSRYTLTSIAESDFEEDTELEPSLVEELRKSQEEIVQLKKKIAELEDAKNFLRPSTPPPQELTIKSPETPSHVLRLRHKILEESYENLSSFVQHERELMQDPHEELVEHNERLRKDYQDLHSQYLDQRQTIIKLEEKNKEVLKEISNLNKDIKTKSFEINLLTEAKTSSETLIKQKDIDHACEISQIENKFKRREELLTSAINELRKDDKDKTIFELNEQLSTEKQKREQLENVLEGIGESINTEEVRGKLYLIEGILLGSKEDVKENDIEANEFIVELEKYKTMMEKLKEENEILKLEVKSFEVFPSEKSIDTQMFEEMLKNMREDCEKEIETKEFEISSLKLQLEELKTKVNEPEEIQGNPIEIEMIKKNEELEALLTEKNVTLEKANLQNQKLEKENSEMYVTLEELQEQFTKKDVDLSRASLQIEELKNDMATLLAKEANLEAKNQELDKLIIEKTSSFQELQEVLSKNEENLSKVQKEATEAKEALKKTLTEINNPDQDLQNGKDDFKLQFEQSESKVQTLSNEIEDLKLKIEKLVSDAEKDNHKNMNLSESLEAFKEVLFSKEKEINLLQLDVNESNAIIQMLQDEKQKLINAYGIEVQLNLLRQQIIKGQETKNNNLSKENDELIEQQRASKGDLFRFKNEVKKLNNKVAELTPKTAELETALGEIERLNSVIEEMETIKISLTETKENKTKLSEECELIKKKLIKITNEKAIVELELEKVLKDLQSDENTKDKISNQEEIQILNGEILKISEYIEKLTDDLEQKNIAIEKKDQNILTNQLKIDDLNKKVVDLEKTVEELEQKNIELDKKDKNVSTNQLKIDELNKKIVNLEAEIKEKSLIQTSKPHTTTFDDLAKKKEEVDRENKRLEDDYKRVAGKFDTIKTELDNTKKILLEKENIIKGLNDKYDSLSKMYKEIKQTYKHEVESDSFKGADRNYLTQKLKTVSDKLKEKETEIDELRQKCHEEKNSKTFLTNEIESLQEELKLAKSAKDRGSNDLLTYNKELEKKLTRLTEMNSDLIETENRLKKAISESKKTEENLKNDMETYNNLYKTEMDSLREINDTMNKELEQLRKQANPNNQVMVDILNKEIKDLTNDLINNENKYKIILEEKDFKFRKLHDEYEKCRTRLEKVIRNEEDLFDKNTELNHKITTLQKNIQSFQINVKQAKFEKPKESKDIEKLKKAMESREQMLVHISMQSDQFKEEIENLKFKLQLAEETLQETKLNLEKASKENKNQGDQIYQLNNEILEYKMKLNENKQIIKKYEDRIKELESEIKQDSNEDKLKDEINILRNQAEKLKELNNEINRKRKQDEDKNKELQRENCIYANEIKLTKNKLEEANKKVENLSFEINRRNEEQDKIKDLQSENSSYANELEINEKKLEEANEKVEKLTSEINKRKDDKTKIVQLQILNCTYANEIKLTENKLEEANKKIEKLTSEINERQEEDQNKIAELQTVNCTYAKEIKLTEQKLEEANKRVEKLTSEINKRKEDHDKTEELQCENFTYTNKIKLTEKKLEDANKKVHELNNEIKQHKDKIEDLESENCIYAKKIMLAEKKLEEVNKNLQLALQNNKKQTEQIAQLYTDINQYKTTLEEKKKMITEGFGQIGDQGKLQVKLDEANENLQKALRDNKEQSEKVEQLTNEMSQCKKTLDDKKLLINEYLDKIQELQNENSTYVNKLTVLMGRERRGSIDNPLPPLSPELTSQELRKLRRQSLQDKGRGIGLSSCPNCEVFSQKLKLSEESLQIYKSESERVLKEKDKKIEELDNEVEGCVDKIKNLDTVCTKARMELKMYKENSAGPKTCLECTNMKSVISKINSDLEKKHALVDKYLAEINELKQTSQACTKCANFENQIKKITREHTFEVVDIKCQAMDAITEKNTIEKELENLKSVQHRLEKKIKKLTGSPVEFKDQSEQAISPCEECETIKIKNTQYKQLLYKRRQEIIQLKTKLGIPVED